MLLLNKSIQPYFREKVAALFCFVVQPWRKKGKAGFLVKIEVDCNGHSKV